MIEPLPSQSFHAHYELGLELGRLRSEPSLELVRTLDVIERVVPAPPGRVLDVGGGPGTYASGLSARGYEVVLVDPVPLHLEQARALSQSGPGAFEVREGDARSLPFPDAHADVVLLLGPLYHLTDRDDRLTALREAHRVLRLGGVLLAAAISRWASLHDGLCRGFVDDPAFSSAVNRTLVDGQHRNDGNNPDWFTTAFFHTPDELAGELRDASWAEHRLVAVEGAASWLPGATERLADPGRRARMLELLRQVESEPALLGASAHLLAVATRPA